MFTLSAPAIHFGMPVVSLSAQKGNTRLILENDNRVQIDVKRIEKNNSSATITMNGGMHRLGPDDSANSGKVTATFMQSPKGFRESRIIVSYPDSYKRKQSK